jgi:hypothetical protein
MRVIRDAWPLILLSSFLVVVICFTFHFDGKHAAVFKCGDAETAVDINMHFQISGLTIDCPKHTHLSGMQKSYYETGNNWLVLCECDK